MPKVKGVEGLEVKDSIAASSVTSPPYDVMNPELEKILNENPYSFYHVILGNNPKQSLEGLISNGLLTEISQPTFYIYHQQWNGQSRLGVLVAAEVTDPKERQIRDHEDVFDDQVDGRIKLADELGYLTGPVFCITKKVEVTKTLSTILTDKIADLSFNSNFSYNGKAISDLHDIQTNIFKIPQDSYEGRLIQGLFHKNPLYIADGHHRFDAALRGNQRYFMAYITDNPNILAYNRLINGNNSFEGIIPELKDKGLKITKNDGEFKAPEEKGVCYVHTAEGTYLVEFNNIPEHVVKGLDVSLVKRDILSLLGLDEVNIKDRAHFHFLPDTHIDFMRRAVQRGEYDIAIALHPISPDEVIAVADANLRMPEKSSYFAPKILSGIVLQKAQYKN